MTTLFNLAGPRIEEINSVRNEEDTKTWVWAGVKGMVTKTRIKSAERKIRVNDSELFEQQITQICITLKTKNHLKFQKRFMCSPWQGQKEIAARAESRFFPFSATNRDFWRLPRQIATFSDPREKSRLFQFSEDQICAFSFKSEGQIYGTNHIHKWALRK